MRLSALLTTAILVTACARGNRPPPLDLLVTAGDSTYWISSSGRGVDVRAAPVTLASAGGQLYEVYVVDDDRSYPDALIIGSVLFARPVTGTDSVLLVQDTLIPRIAAEYARRNPGERPLLPEDDVAEEPSLEATADLELLELLGPYLSYRQHLDLSRDGGEPWHSTRHGVVDVRTGEHLTLDALLGPAEAERVRVEGRRALQKAALDAGEAPVALDDRSFALVVTDSGVGVEFAIPWSGHGGDGDATVLEPVPAGRPAWWSEVAGTLPDQVTDEERWVRDGQAVLARADSTGDYAMLALQAGGTRWELAMLPAPVLRVDWLPPADSDPALRDGLRRAFQEPAPARRPGRITVAAAEGVAEGVAGVRLSFVHGQLHGRSGQSHASAGPAHRPGHRGPASPLAREGAGARPVRVRPGHA
jgi:hypothetical protein